MLEASRYDEVEEPGYLALVTCSPLDITHSKTLPRSINRYQVLPRVSSTMSDSFDYAKAFPNPPVVRDAL
jgi:hypothetical protein